MTQGITLGMADQLVARSVTGCSHETLSGGLQESHAPDGLLWDRGELATMLDFVWVKL